MTDPIENRTDAAVDGLLNDFAKWGGIRLEDDAHQMKAIATKYQRLSDALREMLYGSCDDNGRPDEWTRQYAKDTLALDPLTPTE